MYFVAFVWDARDVERTASAINLSSRIVESADVTVCHESAGMRVFCVDPLDATNKIHRLSSDQGVVLGRLFARANTGALKVISQPISDSCFGEAQSQAIIKSAGANLIRDHWGKYVAFLREPSSERKWVIRDPSGGVPCQHAQIFGIDVYFSRIDEYAALGPPRPGISRHGVVGYLVFRAFVRETLLEGIQTVLPGERIEHLRGSLSRTFIWNPIEIARTDVIDDFNTAVGMTRDTVRECVHAWAAAHPTLVHSTSGGLDSSIVLACLSDAPTSPRVQCRNRYAYGPSTDERAFAREAAACAGFPLVEEEMRASDVCVEELENSPFSLFPLHWPISLRQSSEIAARFEADGVTAVFGGRGGDEVFYRSGILPGAVDYAWRNGLKAELISRALDEAVLDQVSVWRILRLAFRYGIRRKPVHVRSSFRASDCMPLMCLTLKEQAWEDQTHWHPLYREVIGVPPAKLYHAYLLTFGTNSVYMPTARGSRIESVEPLLSQPMLELSLRIPTYLLRHGGQDRAIARQAFASSLPRSISTRKSKAFGTSQLEEIIRKNISYVRKQLLNGFLLHEGYLDRDNLTEVLESNVASVRTGAEEIALYLSIEAWAKRCLSGVEWVTRRSFAERRVAIVGN